MFKEKTTEEILNLINDVDIMNMILTICKGGENK